MLRRPVHGLALAVGLTVVGLIGGACHPEREPEAVAASSGSDEKDVAGPVGVDAPPSARGTRAALRSIEMRVTAADRSTDRVRLEIVFENGSETAYGLSGELGGADLRLVEASGASHSPLAVSGELERIDGGDGLAPGSTRAGTVVFPAPASDRFELRLPGFTPLPLRRAQIPTVDADFASSSAPGPAEVASSSRPEAKPEPEREAIVRLLATQASALERFDFDRYLDTFVAERRAAERDVFAGRRQLPLTDVDLRLGRKPLVAEAPGRRGEVELRYRFDRLPADNPFVHRLSFLFVPTADGWQVAEIRNASARPVPWRQGPLAVHRTNHFLIYTDPDMQSDLVELAGDAEAAYATLYRRGLPMASGYLVHFARGNFPGGRGGLAILGAAQVRYEIAEEHLSVHSRSLFINASAFSESRRWRLTPERRRVTVTHELAHLALGKDSRPYTPPWLIEGAAVYFSGDLSYDEDRQLVRRGMNHLSLDAMTRVRSLTEHGTRRGQVADEYLFSGNVVAYLVERRGLPALLALYRSFAELPGSALSDGRSSLAEAFGAVSGETTARVTAEALRRDYGLTVIELEAEVKQWLAVQHR